MFNSELHSRWRHSLAGDELHLRAAEAMLRPQATVEGLETFRMWSGSRLNVKYLPCYQVPKWRGTGVRVVLIRVPVDRLGSPRQ